MKNKKLLYIFKFEFTKILSLSETYRRHTGDPSETEIPDRRPIGDLDMLHWRPYGDRHAPPETHWRLTFLARDRHICLINRLTCLIRVLTLFQFK